MDTIFEDGSFSRKPGCSDAFSMSYETTSAFSSAALSARSAGLSSTYRIFLGGLTPSDTPPLILAAKHLTYDIKPEYFNWFPLSSVLSHVAIAVLLRLPSATSH